MSKAKLRADAINRFIVDAKSQGVYDSLKAACLLTGWDTIAGALTPLVGAAPTNNGFGASDYDRGGVGLQGDGSSKYLDSNRDATDDPQDDYHVAIHCSSPGSGGVWYGAGAGQVGSTNGGINTATGLANARSRNNAPVTGTQVGYSGTYVVSRSSSTSVDLRWNNETQSLSQVSQTPVAKDMWVFARNEATLEAYSDATLSYYSIGSSVDLAILDTLVSRLMADLRAIEEDGMDRDALAYIRAVEAADGSYLETGVKQAIDQFVQGMKYDKDANGRSAWDALGACCIMAGARTISGALVPLKGPAPTAEGAWVSSDYDRATGLVGNQSSGNYLAVGLGSDDLLQNDNHVAAYLTANATDLNSNPWITDPYDGNGRLRLQDYYNVFYSWNYMPTNLNRGPVTTGFVGCARQSPTGASFRASGSYNNYASASVAATFSDIHFLRFGNNRMAFFSAGSALDLAALDTRVSTLISSIATALS